MAGALKRTRGSHCPRLVARTTSMRPWNFGEIKTRFNKADDGILESQLAGDEEVELGIIFGCAFTPHRNFRYTPTAMGGGGSSSVSDVDNYVIVRKLLDSIFYILPAFTSLWEIRNTREFCSVRLAAGSWSDEMNNILNLPNPSSLTRPWGLLSL
jgi:hypothetical protein